jgi:DNA primase
MSRKCYDDAFLRRLRNEIPIDWLIQHIGWPSKHREGQFVFLCPCCRETLSAVKRETNLGRCFHCETNFNPIDFMMQAQQFDFVQAVEYLTPLLRRR